MASGIAYAGGSGPSRSDEPSRESLDKSGWSRQCRGSAGGPREQGSGQHQRASSSGLRSWSGSHNCLRVVDNASVQSILAATTPRRSALQPGRIAGRWLCSRWAGGPGAAGFRGRRQAASSRAKPGTSRWDGEWDLQVGCERPAGIGATPSWADGFGRRLPRQCDPRS